MIIKATKLVFNEAFAKDYKLLRGNKIESEKGCIFIWHRDEIAWYRVFFFSIIIQLHNWTVMWCEHIF